MVHYRKCALLVHPDTDGRDDLIYPGECAAARQTDFETSPRVFHPAGIHEAAGGISLRCHRRDAEEQKEGIAHHGLFLYFYIEITKMAYSTI